CDGAREGFPLCQQGGALPLPHRGGTSPPVQRSRCLRCLPQLQAADPIRASRCPPPCQVLPGLQASRGGGSGGVGQGIGNRNPAQLRGPSTTARQLAGRSLYRPILPRVPSYSQFPIPYSLS